jgi:hypothetical protein
MASLYLDSNVSDATRRERLYGGDIFVLSPSAASTRLCNFCRHLIEESFAPHDPLTAQYKVPVDEYVGAAGPLKTRLAHHPEAQRLLRETLAEVGCDLGETYYDVPKLRVVTSGEYLSAGVGYPLHVHRDTWYSAPMSQLNWWMPLYPIESESSMAVFSKYWHTAVANDSSKFNYYDWNRERKTATKLTGKDNRFQPHPQEPIEMEPHLRIVCQPGGLIVFSGAQLHATIPNTSRRTRFSIDFRTVHIGDLEAGRAAQNVDSSPQGTSLRDFMRGTDRAHLPSTVVARYEDAAATRGHENDLVYTPEESGEEKLSPR